MWPAPPWKFLDSAYVQTRTVSARDFIFTSKMLFKFSRIGVLGENMSNFKNSLSVINYKILIFVF